MFERQLFSLAFIGLFLISDTQQIIRGGIIEIRQSDQKCQRNLAITCFVLAIGVLANMQIICDLLLCQVRILPKITNTNSNHPFVFIISITNRDIDNYLIL